MTIRPTGDGRFEAVFETQLEGYVFVQQDMDGGVSVRVMDLNREAQQSIPANEIGNLIDFLQRVWTEAYRTDKVKRLGYDLGRYDYDSKDS
jgi:hypothetical protein